ncbi:MAG: hypothetical protein ACRDHZ_00045 [Ktedonobacteraceae bacterium]
MKDYGIAVAMLLLLLIGMAIYNETSTTNASTQLAVTSTNGTPLPPLKAKPGAFSLLGKPTISAHLINQVLAHYNSPAQGTGQAMYDLGKQAGVDPVYALAFFLHESGFGTTGEARTTYSLGNERCIKDRPCIDQDRGGYAQMNDWVDGYAHWYTLIRAYASGEIKRELTGHSTPLITVSQIIPTYAPSSDHNNERAYIQAIEHAVNTWREGQIIVS